MSVLPKELAATLLLRTRQRQATEERERLGILNVLKTTLPAMAKEIDCGRVWVIGSVAWGDFGVRSDVDLVLENSQGMANRAEVGHRISKLVSREVDVLALDQLTESFRHRVLNEGIRVA